MTLRDLFGLDLFSISVIDPLDCDNELITHVHHDKRVHTHMSKLHNEESASHQHDKRKTGLEYESQNNPVVSDQIFNAIKGFGKRLSKTKHNIPQPPSIGATLPNRTIRGGMTDICTRKINLVIASDRATFTI